MALLLSLTMEPTASPAQPAGGLPEPGLSPEETGSPACGIFHDRWEVTGISAQMLAVAGVGRELMAANDCLQKKDTAGACEHWRRLLPIVSRPDLPLAGSRADLEKLMREHKCAP